LVRVPRPGSPVDWARIAFGASSNVATSNEKNTTLRAELDRTANEYDFMNDSSVTKNSV
jgi:hypothetical protein